jgi:hypothetical protein
LEEPSGGQILRLNRRGDRRDGKKRKCFPVEYKG